MKVNFAFTGGTELLKSLNALPSAISTKVQLQALRAGADLMRAEAEALAPRSDDAPHIADHIIVGLPRTPLEDVREEDAAVLMGPEKGFFYGFFLEFGTVRTAAQPFMRPAFDGKAPQSLDVIGKQLWMSIEKASAQLFRKQAVTTAKARATPTFGGGFL